MWLTGYPQCLFFEGKKSTAEMWKMRRIGFHFWFFVRSGFKTRLCHNPSADWSISGSRMAKIRAGFPNLLRFLANLAKLLRQKWQFWRFQRARAQFSHLETASQLKKEINQRRSLNRKCVANNYGFERRRLNNNSKCATFAVWRNICW